MKSVGVTITNTIDLLYKLNEEQNCPACREFNEAIHICMDKSLCTTQDYQNLADCQLSNYCVSPRDCSNCVEQENAWMSCHLEYCKDSTDPNCESDHCADTINAYDTCVIEGWERTAVPTSLPTNFPVKNPPT